ncbi:MAG: bifunctional folylpolyglutamate synthase/dihydrofolate synthase [Gemmatimonadetes bacterium]|nr:bifunctional folylpolyglutamate synthase/dihydrofolate synthase [Gemmatimonadota bacterium]
MTIEELAPWLFGRTAGGIRWGLERTRELLAEVGDPHTRFRSIHIGGTNGKGSVAALCDSALRAVVPGLRVGLYTSPHLVSFSERIRIDGRPVDADPLLAAAERLRPTIERLEATFFEATTAIAFLCFAEAGVEIAVVEVGLGGRLDATNVILPEAVGITNVALDHTEYLGDTVTEIAAEKAGILKPGVPAVTAASHPDALRVMRSHAKRVGASLAVLDEIARVEQAESSLDGTRLRFRSRQWGEGVLEVPLAGAFQQRNALLAAELLALLPPDLRPTWSALRAGFAAVRWPGRLTVHRAHGATFVFDVAHNAAGVGALCDSLDFLDLPRPLVLVAGILSDKDWAAMLPPLCARVDASVFTIPPSSPPARRWDPGEAARVLAPQLASTPRVIPALSAALQRALTLAPYGTILVTGSIHTVGDAMAELKIPVV